MKPYYEHGGISIYHCDCREFLRSEPYADLCFTDPPYAIKHMDGCGIAAAREFYAGGALDGLCDFALNEYEILLSQLAPQIVAFHSRDQILDYARFCNARYDGYDLHAWYKVNAIPFTHNTWKSDLEYIALGWRGKKNHNPNVEQHIKSKLFSSGIETSNLHPTQKPIAIALKYLRVLQPDTVIDPFMGSGTTLRAAKDLGLQAIGIEREEKYCEIAARRLQQEVFNFDSVLTKRINVNTRISQMIHHIKIWPRFYDEVAGGQKTSQLRRDDRNYNIGDQLTMEEYDPELEIYTGRTVRAFVTDKITDCVGLIPEYCILSIKLPERPYTFVSGLAGATSQQRKELLDGVKEKTEGTKEVGGKAS